MLALASPHLTFQASCPMTVSSLPSLVLGIDDAYPDLQLLQSFSVIPVFSKEHSFTKGFLEDQGTWHFSVKAYFSLH